METRRDSFNKKLHEMFYGKLRRLGFRECHVSEVCRCAKEVIEAKRNGGSKPVLKKLTAELR